MPCQEGQRRGMRAHIHRVDADAYVHADVDAEFHLCVMHT
jgi:hypothetical protein